MSIIYPLSLLLLLLCPGQATDSADSEKLELVVENLLKALQGGDDHSSKALEEVNNSQPPDDQIGKAKAKSTTKNAKGDQKAETIPPVQSSIPEAKESDLTQDDAELIADLLKTLSDARIDDKKQGKVSLEKDDVGSYVQALSPVDADKTQDDDQDIEKLLTETIKALDEYPLGKEASKDAAIQDIAGMKETKSADDVLHSTKTNTGLQKQEQVKNDGLFEELQDATLRKEMAELNIDLSPDELKEMKNVFQSWKDGEPKGDEDEDTMEGDEKLNKTSKRFSAQKKAYRSVRVRTRYSSTRATTRVRVRHRLTGTRVRVRQGTAGGYGPTATRVSVRTRRTNYVPVPVGVGHVGVHRNIYHRNNNNHYYDNNNAEMTSAVTVMLSLFAVIPILLTMVCW